MASNLQKFVNPKFLRSVPLQLMRRLLERHRDARGSFDLAGMAADSAIVRDRLARYFQDGREHPEGLVADLHRIAEVGTENGLMVLLEQARRRGVALVVRPGSNPAKEDPKYVAMSAFLDHPGVFDDAADSVAFFRRSAIAEFYGAEAGVEAGADSETLELFRRAAKSLFEEDLLGDYCRVGCYEDGDELCLMLTHGAPVASMAVLRNAKEHIACYRPTAQARLRYSAAEGRLKIGGVRKNRRGDVAEAFAGTVLRRPGFFAGSDAQALYSLAPVERNWTKFLLAHAHDPYIRRVRIVEAQVERVSPDLAGQLQRPEWSVTVADRNGHTLELIRQLCPNVEFMSGRWRLSRVVLQADIQEARRRPASVIVTIQPEAQAVFRRLGHEARIMELLRRNGFCKDRIAAQTALAAE